MGLPPRLRWGRPSVPATYSWGSLGHLPPRRLRRQPAPKNRLYDLAAPAPAPLAHFIGPGGSRRTPCSLPLPSARAQAGAGVAVRAATGDGNLAGLASSGGRDIPLLPSGPRPRCHDDRAHAPSLAWACWCLAWRSANRSTLGAEPSPLCFTLPLSAWAQRPAWTGSARQCCGGSRSPCAELKTH